VHRLICVLTVALIAGALGCGGESDPIKANDGEVAESRIEFIEEDGDTKVWEKRKS
jgi:hypothetical protein